MTTSHGTQQHDAAQQDNAVPSRTAAAASPGQAPQPWPDVSLPLTDLAPTPPPGDQVRVEWLGLHQGRNGAVVQRDGGYFAAGSPVAEHLVGMYERFIGQGLLVLGQPSAGGHRRVAITASGRALLTPGAYVLPVAAPAHRNRAHDEHPGSES